MPLNSEQSLTLLDRMAKTNSAGAWNAVAFVVSGVDPSFTGVGIFEWRVEMTHRLVATGA